MSGINAAIKEYNSLTDRSSKTAFAKTVSTNNEALGKYLAGLKGTSGSLYEYAKALTTASLKTNALEAAKTAFSTAVRFGTTAVIETAISGIQYLMNYESIQKAAFENAKKATAEAASSIRSLKSEMSDTASKASGLSSEFSILVQGVNPFTNENENLSTQEYERFLEVNNELAELFPSLTSNYDENGNAILGLSGDVDTVTASIQKLVEQQNYLAKADMRTHMEEFVNGTDDTDGVFDVLDGQKNKVQDAEKELNKFDDAYRGFMNKNGRVSFNIEDSVSLNTYLDYISDMFGTEAYEALYDTRNISNDSQTQYLDFSKLELDEAAKEKITKSYNTFHQDLQTELSIRQSELESKNKEMSDTMMAWVTDLGLYDGDPFMNQVATSMVGSIQWSELPDDSRTLEGAKQYIQDTVLGPLSAACSDPAAKNALSSLFTLDFSQLNYTEANEQIKGYLSAIMNAFNEGKPEEEKKNLLDMYDMFGFGSYDQTAVDMKKNITGLSMGNSGFFNPLEYAKLTFYTKDFNQAQTQAWLASTTGAKNAAEAVRLYKENIKNQSEPPKSFSEIWNSIGATGTDQQKSDKDKLLELAQAGKLTKEALENTSLASVFEEAGVSIEKATEKVNAFADETKQLSAMKTGINAITSAYEEKSNSRQKTVSSSTLESLGNTLGTEDWNGSDKKVWENYKSVAGDSTKTLKELKAAQDELAASYVNSNSFLANIEDGSYQYYVSLLKEMGVTNAAAVATEALNRKKADAKLTNFNLAEASNEEISSFGNYITSLQGANGALGDYIIKKQLAAGADLETSGSIQNLINLATQCGATSDVIIALKELLNATDDLSSAKGKSLNDYNVSAGTDLKHAYDDLENQKDADVEKQTVKVENAKNKLKKLLKGAKTAVTTSSRIKTNGGDGNTTPKIEKQEFNWFERRLTRMQDIIDLTAAKLQNLFSVKAKNKNLDRQIKQSTLLMKQYGSAAKKYQKKADSIANGKKKEKGLPKNIVSQIKSGSLTKKDAKMSQKYSQSEYDKISQYIDYHDKARQAEKSQEEQQAKLRDLKKQRYQVTADHAEARISLYEQQKNNAGTAEKKNKYLGKELEQYKRSCQYQISIAKLSKDTTEQARLRAEYEAKITELKKEQLQNTLDENSEQNALLDARLANASTADEKNAILNEQIGVVRSDSQAYAANYSQALSNRSAQSSKAAAAAGKDKSKKLKAADRKKIKQLISQNQPVPDTLLNKCSAKTQAQLAEYNASLDWVTDALKARTLNDEKAKTKERELNVQQHQNNAEHYQSELDLLSARKDNAKSAADKNSILAEEAGMTSQLYAEKIAIAQLEGNITEEARLQEELKKQLNSLSIEQHQNLADEHQAQLDLSAAQQDGLTDAAKKNQLVEQEKAATSALYAEKMEIARLEGDSTREQQLQEELANQLVALEKKKLDNIAEYYEYQRKLNDNQRKSLSSDVSELEARGLIVSKNMYASQIALNEENRKNRQEELAELTRQHGKIKEGTKEWYDSLDSIQACKDGISDCTMNILEMQKAMRQTDWKIFEKMSSQLDLVSSEYDMFIKLMSGKKMFDSSGNFTKEGTATLGAQYGRLLLTQKKKEASGELLTDARTRMEDGEAGYTDPVAAEEINEAAREHIALTTEEYELKQEMADFMRERYSAELGYMQDIINKRKDLLQAEKDEYDYRRTIEDKTKNISVITRQLTALSGDDSEAARTRIQQLKVSLDEAKQDLQDTEYDRWVSDQQTMLDNLYNDYNTFMEDRMNDTDALFQEAVDYLNGGNIGSEVAQTLSEYADEYNYNPSADFQNINTSLETIGSFTGSIDSACKIITDHLKTMQENQEKADALSADINSVAAISNYDDYEKAKEVIEQYKEAPDEVKNLISSASKSSMDATIQRVADIETNAGHTKNAINAIGTVTLDSYQAIQDANTWYNSLDAAGRQLVDNSGLKTVLDNANEVYAGLVHEADLQRQAAESAAAEQQTAAEQQAKQNTRNQIKDWIVRNKDNANYWEKQTYEQASPAQKFIHDNIFDPGPGHLGGKRYLSATGMRQLVQLLNSLNIPGSNDLYHCLSDIGFADGGIADALQKIPVANGDDGWITVKRGESILNREQTRSFAALARNLDTLNMTADLRKNLSGSMSSSLPERGIHSTSIGDISMNIELPNVTNYEEFRRKMQSDPKVESMFKSMLWDKGSLSKYKTRV